MSLDIHLGKTEKEAEISDRELFLSEELHEFVFHESGRIEKLGKQFSRLNDYYKDTLFQGTEIDDLKSELIVLAEKVNSQSLKDFLISFAKVCDKARSQHMNIYCFCD